MLLNEVNACRGFRIALKTFAHALMTNGHISIEHHLQLALARIFSMIDQKVQARFFCINHHHLTQAW